MENTTMDNDARAAAVETFIL
jgi:hypothetical protein